MQEMGSKHTKSTSPPHRQSAQLQVAIHINMVSNNCQSRTMRPWRLSYQRLDHEPVAEQAEQHQRNDHQLGLVDITNML